MQLSQENYVIFRIKITNMYKHVMKGAAVDCLFFLSRISNQIENKNGKI